MINVFKSFYKSTLDLKNFFWKVNEFNLYWVKDLQFFVKKNQLWIWKIFFSLQKYFSVSPKTQYFLECQKTSHFELKYQIYSYIIFSKCDILSKKMSQLCHKCDILTQMWQFDTKCDIRFFCFQIDFWTDLGTFLVTFLPN